MRYVSRKLMLQVALQYVHVIRRERAWYAEYRSWWLRRGYLPPYCPHGRYLWTDTDPICQSCEDGEPNIYQQALTFARERVAAADAMGSAVKALAAGGVAQDIQVELMRRVFDLLQVDDTP